MQDEREYRSKFLKEFQEEFGKNVFPDYDEIYKRYDKLKKENEKLIAKNLELETLCDKYEEEHSTKFNEWVFDKRENERLTQGVTLLTNELIDMTKEKEDYKSRNENAIEYLEYQISNMDFEEDIKAKMLGAMAIVILQGVDKE